MAGLKVLRTVVCWDEKWVVVMAEKTVECLGGCLVASWAQKKVGCLELSLVGWMDETTVVHWVSWLVVERVAMLAVWWG